MNWAALRFGLKQELHFHVGIPGCRAERPRLLPELGFSGDFVRLDMH